MDVPNPRLSDGNYDNHLSSKFTPLCSRDINPYQVVGGNWPLIASSNGMVVVVDHTQPDISRDNFGLGNFVAIRLPTTDLPDEIKTILKQQYPSIANDIISNHGYLHIGYGHLNTVSVDLMASVFKATPPLGLSGKTGLEADPGASEHLDVTVYYVSATGPVKPDPWRLTTIDASQGYFNIFVNTDMRYGVTQAIDPVFLWPVVETGILNIVRNCGAN